MLMLIGLALSPGHSQILSHSCGEKLGEGLGSLLHHRLASSWTGNGGLGLYQPSPPFPVRDVPMIPGLLPIFLHGCEIKSGSGLGTRLRLTAYVLASIFATQTAYLVQVATAYDLVAPLSRVPLYRVAGSSQ